MLPLSSVVGIAALQIPLPTESVQNMVHFSSEKHVSTGQMSPCSLSSLHHTEISVSVSVPHTMHHSRTRFLSDSL